MEIEDLEPLAAPLARLNAEFDKLLGQPGSFAKSARPTELEQINEILPEIQKALAAQRASGNRQDTILFERRRELVAAAQALGYRFKGGKFVSYAS